MSKRIEKLEARLRQAKLDAERNVRLRPLEALSSRLVKIEVFEEDRELIAELLHATTVRIKEIEDDYATR